MILISTVVSIANINPQYQRRRLSKIFVFANPYNLGILFHPKLEMRKFCPFSCRQNNQLVVTRLSGKLYLTYEGIFTIYCKNITKTFRRTSKRAVKIGPYMGCMFQAENQTILPNYPLLPDETVDIKYVIPSAWF
jgi:hypothetical protein